MMKRYLKSVLEAMKQISMLCGPYCGEMAVILIHDNIMMPHKCGGVSNYQLFEFVLTACSGWENTRAPHHCHFARETTWPLFSLKKGT